MNKTINGTSVIIITWFSSLMTFLFVEMIDKQLSDEGATIFLLYITFITVISILIAYLGILAVGKNEIPKNHEKKKKPY